MNDSSRPSGVHQHKRVSHSPAAPQPLVSMCGKSNRACWPPRHQPVLHPYSTDTSTPLLLDQSGTKPHGQGAHWGAFFPSLFSPSSSATRGTTRSSCPVPGGIEGGLDPRSRCEVLVPPSRKWLSVLNVLHRIPPRRVANRLLKRTSEQCRRRRYVRRRNGPLAARGRPHERGEPV